jgi:hypothetical protein
MRFMDGFALLIKRNACLRVAFLSFIRNAMHKAALLLKTAEQCTKPYKALITFPKIIEGT